MMKSSANLEIIGVNEIGRRSLLTFGVVSFAWLALPVGGDVCLLLCQLQMFLFERIVDNKTNWEDNISAKSFQNGTPSGPGDLLALRDFSLRNTSSSVTCNLDVN